MRKPEAAAQFVTAAFSCHIVSPASAPQVQPVWLPTGEGGLSCPGDRRPDVTAKRCVEKGHTGADTAVLVLLPLL